MPRPKVNATKKRGDRPLKLECPPESEWSQFLPAINGVHWKTVDNKRIRQTHGKGFLCLIMDNPIFCRNFAKKVSFMRHFWTHHKLNPESIKRGRPGNGERSRLVLSEEARERQDERLKGDFLGKVWRAKKTHLGTMINWAVTMQAACSDNKDASEWILELAVKRYGAWRKSEAFTNTIHEIAKRTKAFWRDKNPNMSREEIREKANMPPFRKLDSYESDDGMPSVDVEKSDLKEGIFHLLPRTHNMSNCTSEEEVALDSESDSDADDQQERKKRKIAKSLDEEKHKATEKAATEKATAKEAKKTVEDLAKSAKMTTEELSKALAQKTGKSLKKAFGVPSKPPMPIQASTRISARFKALQMVSIMTSTKKEGDRDEDHDTSTEKKT